MASIIEAITKSGDLLRDIGMSGLNVAYPNEFEVYMCALELVSAKTNKTLSYFVFPVMPESISQDQQYGINIKRTSLGIVSMSTQGFIPKEINLSGTFGRSFKTLVGDIYVDLSSSVRGVALKDKVENVLSVFDQRVKTGYGCTKVLEEIIENSRLIDSSGPRLLYFYNLAFNSRFIVAPISLRFSQDMSNNTMWKYSLSLKALAPLDASKKGARTQASMNADKVVSKTLNSVVFASEKALGTKSFAAVKTTLGLIKGFDLKDGKIKKIVSKLKLK